MSHNVVSFEDLKKGRTLPKVKLLTTLDPENIFDQESGVTYQAGWIGRVIEIEPRNNHVDYLPVLFEDYEIPVWIPSKYLELVL